MPETAHCEVANCGLGAIADLEGRRVCREHFITGCYDCIETYLRQLREHAFREAAAETLRNFLLNCTRQAIDLAQGLDDLENLERARLLDILMRASELGRHLRRSPRKEAVIALELRCEKLGHAWEEVTQTRVLSRYGALLNCQHDAETGDTLVVVRRDNARQTRARVAWCHVRPEGGREIGIELLNCDNFWEMDWADTSVPLHEPEMVLKFSRARDGQRTRSVEAVTPPPGQTPR
jgi:hypothetical protein